MRYKEAVRKLKALGCQELPRRSGGSHRKWLNTAPGRATALPDRGARDFEMGTPLRPRYGSSASSGKTLRTPEEHAAARQEPGTKVKEDDTLKQTIDVIYENGVFKPLKDVQIPEGEQVRITLESTQEDEAEDLLELAALVYQDLPEKVVDEIEQIALDRSNFLGIRIS